MIFSVGNLQCSYKVHSSKPNFTKKFTFLRLNSFILSLSYSDGSKNLITTGNLSASERNSALLTVVTIFMCIKLYYWGELVLYLLYFPLIYLIWQEFDLKSKNRFFEKDTSNRQMMTRVSMMEKRLPPRKSPIVPPMVLSTSRISVGLNLVTWVVRDLK